MLLSPSFGGVGEASIFVSLSTVVKADRLLTLYKSEPLSYGKAVFYFQDFTLL